MGIGYFIGGYLLCLLHNTNLYFQSVHHFIFQTIPGQDIRIALSKECTFQETLRFVAFDQKKMFEGLFPSSIYKVL